VVANLARVTEQAGAHKNPDDREEAAVTKQPHVPPMTLGNMRKHGVHRLSNIALNDVSATA